MPMVEHFTNLPDEQGTPLYGANLRKRLQREYGSQLTLVAVGGMIPNADCRCEIDPVVKNRLGIPVLRFHWKWGRQELEQMHHATAAMTEMITAMGGAVFAQPKPEENSALRGVTLMHETGTVRMGTTAKDSVLNANGHAWEVRNLYVADGASFTSHADKNPTHTIMALAWRANEHLADSLMRKEI
jgi:choline dehydrogenase-like flavoprotein